MASWQPWKRESVSRLPRAEGAQLRTAVPDLPRQPTADELVLAARRVAMQAVRDEFVREGLDAVTVPSPLNRETLASAQLAETTEYRQFMLRTLQALDLRSEILHPDDVIEQASSPAARDLFGFTLESAGTVASLLAQRAAAVQSAPRKPEPELVEAIITGLVEAVTHQLHQQVAVPQELRLALQRKNQIAALPQPVVKDVLRKAAARAQGKPLTPGPENVRLGPGSAQVRSSSQTSAGGPKTGHAQGNSRAPNGKQSTGASSTTSSERVYEGEIHEDGAPAASAEAWLKRAGRIAVDARDFAQSETGRHLWTLARMGLASYRESGPRSSGQGSYDRDSQSGDSYSHESNGQDSRESE